MSHAAPMLIPASEKLLTNDLPFVVSYLGALSLAPERALQEDFLSGHNLSMGDRAGDNARW